MSDPSQDPSRDAADPFDPGPADPSTPSESPTPATPDAEITQDQQVMPPDPAPPIALKIGLIGLLVVIAVVLLGLQLHFRDQARITLIEQRDDIVGGVFNSELPAEDKRGIIARMDELFHRIHQGEVPESAPLHMVEFAHESPALIAAGYRTNIRRRVIEPSILSPEAKAAARQALDRIAYGFTHGDLGAGDLAYVAEPISGTTEDQRQQIFKIVPSVQLIEQFVDRANEVADQAGIAKTDVEVDIVAVYGDVIEQAIDRAREEEAAGGTG